MRGRFTSLIRSGKTRRLLVQEDQVRSPCRPKQSQRSLLRLVSSATRRTCTREERPAQAQQGLRPKLFPQRREQTTKKSVQPRQLSWTAKVLGQPTARQLRPRSCSAASRAGATATEDSARPACSSCQRTDSAANANLLRVSVCNRDGNRHHHAVAAATGRTDGVDRDIGDGKR